MNLKRLILPTIACLFAGALLSVASSWLCEYRFSGMGLGPSSPLANRTWPMPIDPTWPAEAASPTQAERLDGPGIQIRSFIAYGSVDSFNVTEIRSGWPIACMRRFSSSRWPMTSSLLPRQQRPDDLRYAGLNLLKHPNPAGISIVPDGQAYFPVLPVWGAFAASTVLYAVPAGVLWFFAVGFRAWRRTRKGLCVACGYPRGASAVCTECGKQGVLA
ncbi:MAG: hypothetical protein HEQ23_02915 [Tepidisphaera sp.]